MFVCFPFVYSLFVLFYSNLTLLGYLDYFLQIALNSVKTGVCVVGLEFVTVHRDSAESSVKRKACVTLHLLVICIGLFSGSVSKANHMKS